MKKIHWFLIIILAVMVGVVWYAVFRAYPGVLTVAFLDVGQGDSIYIEAPNGNQVILDSGPNRAVLEQLSSVMPFYDRTIDALIASHADADHIGGFRYILDDYDVGSVLEGGGTSSSMVYSTFENGVTKENAQKVIVHRGMKLELGGGAWLDIIFPTGRVVNAEGNESSVVARLTYGGASFMLTGDAPASVEKYLAEVGGKDLHSDVLKVGHHGSRTSTSDAFLGWVQPTYAVISVGAKNRYGHPNAEVIDKLNKANIKILRTDEEGTIVMKSDGNIITCWPRDVCRI